MRTAASAVDPLIRFYLTDLIQFPGGHLTFDQKIEHVLAASGMPSYASVDANGLSLLGKLYRARNSMHEGDIYFKEATGTSVKVDVPMAETFLAAAEQFALWIDSRAVVARARGVRGRSSPPRLRATAAPLGWLLCRPIRLVEKDELAVVGPDHNLGRVVLLAVLFP